MKNDNEHIWRACGLTPEGMKIAEEAMATMLKAVELAGSRDLALAVTDAAIFQVYELPKRAADFQAKFRWAPPSSESK